MVQIAYWSGLVATSNKIHLGTLTTTILYSTAFLVLMLTYNINKEDIMRYLDFLWKIKWDALICLIMLCLYLYNLNLYPNNEDNNGGM